MKDRPLPIGVVIPTRNVRPALQAHLAQLHTWADLVEEIVVVDSHSADGTVDLLRTELRHPRLRILDRPPGLYQSWNYGIQQLTTKYIYLSTIGDAITAEGLQHLATAADELNSDVIVSPPGLFDLAGQPVTDRRWPIHKFLDWCPLDRPVTLEPWHAFLLTTINVPDSILGSSASNLYRTETLRRFPFPAEYGHSGDTAWGLRYSWRVVLAVTPKSFSRFIVHPNEGNLARDAEVRLMAQFYDLEDQVIREFLQSPAAAAGPKTEPGIAEIVAATHDLHQRQRRYWEARREFWPWLINPGAWRARTERNRQREQLSRVKARLRQSLDSLPEPAPASLSQRSDPSPNGCLGYLGHRILKFVANLPI